MKKPADRERGPVAEHLVFVLGGHDYLFQNERIHMSKFRPMIFVTALLLWTSMLLAGAQAQNITIGVPQDVTGFDPRLSTDVTSLVVQQVMYNSLIRLADDLSIVPDLAERWETPSPTEYVFYLRQGVLFHDGVELTAEDVKFTYDTIRDPDFGSPNLSLFAAIEEIEVVDDYTVRFLLSDPFPPLLAYMDRGIVPMHIASQDRGQLSQTPIGSGPYQLQQWTANERIVLQAFDGYFDGRPNFDQITLRVIIEDAVRVIEFEIGGVDIIFRVPLQDVERLEANPNFQIFSESISGYGYFMMNHAVVPFNDVRVRKAIAHAIDKQEITDLVYYGINAIADSPIIPQSWAYADDIQDYEHDLERARELLTEAGYPNGFDVTFKTFSQTEILQSAEMLAAQLARIGINLELEVFEWSNYFSQIIASDFAFAGPQFWFYQADPDQAVYRQFHSDLVPPRGVNRHSYSNPRVDEILDMARTETDQELRAEYYREIQHLLVDDVAYIFMWFPHYFQAAQANIHNFSFSPYSGYFNFVREGSID